MVKPSSYITSLENANAELRTVIAILIKQQGGKVTISDEEIYESSDSDPVLHSVYSEDTHSRTLTVN